MSEEAEEAAGLSEAFSCVTMETHKDMEDPVNMKKSSTHTSKEPHTHRPPSPVSSCVSMKSNVSMHEGPYFSREPVPSGGKPHTHRPPSPVSSCVSMKSNVSMHEGPYFSREPVPSGGKPHTHRPPSPVSSCVSMKSNVSMHEGPYFSREPVPSGGNVLRPSDPQPPLDDDDDDDEPTDMAESSRHLQTEHTPHTKSTQDDEVLRKVKKNHKASLKKRFENISEGIIKPGAETLLSEIYTELYITEGESEGVHKEHEVCQVESAFRAQTPGDTPINCNDIFRPLPGQEHIRTVMTKGVAGIGKTVSVHKFILDWIDGVANQDIDFIFPIPFRALNLVRSDIYSLHSLLLAFHPELKELRNGEEYKDCQIIFIFDGLDESRLKLIFEHDKNLSDLNQISSVDVLMISLIQGSLLPSALVWITSRPAAASQIPAQYIDQLTEVRGFNDPQKEEFFRRRISDENQANRIISHIKASRSLHIMCYIPVFCWITATVLQEMLGKINNKDIPKTLTEMFTQFLLIQTARKDKKYQSGTEADKEKLLESQKDTLLKLAELAFRNLENGNLMFYEEDLRECGIDVTEASVYSGICTEIFKVESVFHQKVYCFVHLSIQEFLAAVFVFHSYVNESLDPLKSLLSDEHKSFLSYLLSTLGWKTQDQHALHMLLKSAVDEALKSKNGHLDLFLRFLTGISLESNQRLLQDIFNKIHNTSKSIKETCRYIKNLNREDLSPERCINLFHCLFEMNDHSMHKGIQKFLSSKNFKQKLSPAHCSALAHMLLMSEEVLDELDLKIYNTSDEGRRRLIPAVRCCRKARLSDCKLSDKSFGIVAAVLQSPNSLTELDLSTNDLRDAGVQLLSKGLSSSHCKLQILRLSGCFITEKGCACLTSALTSNSSFLKELDLINNHIGESGLKLLSASLEDPICKLEMLKTDQGVFRARPCLLRYACKLTLDPNTAHRRLSLSEGNRKVTCVREEQPYPDHPGRFDEWQVLCREGLSGRCYWEAEWSGDYGSRTAVAYKSIKRKGGSVDIIMGHNVKSWSLICSPHRYSVSHNNKDTVIPAPSSGSRRVGVYLDWPAGTLSFYSVSSDTLTHLHTFHSTFTEPLYPGFYVRIDSSVSLCQIT